jgi:hypothetical protein
VSSSEKDFVNVVLRHNSKELFRAINQPIYFNYEIAGARLCQLEPNQGLGRAKVLLAYVLNNLSRLTSTLLGNQHVA